MKIDLYFPPNIPLDRDEIEAALETELGEDIEVTGAGTGISGSNLDLEVAKGRDRDRVVREIVEILTRLGVPDSTIVALIDGSERTSLADLRKRYL